MHSIISAVPHFEVMATPPKDAATTCQFVLPDSLAVMLTVSMALQALKPSEVASLWTTKAMDLSAAANATSDSASVRQHNSSSQALNFASGPRYLLVTDRYTMSGNQCIFPAAASGTVIADCIAFPPADSQYRGAANASAGWCPTAPQTWEPCMPYESPLPGSSYVPVATRETSTQACILPSVVKGPRSGGTNATAHEMVALDCVSLSDLSDRTGSNMPRQQDEGQCLVESGEVSRTPVRLDRLLCLECSSSNLRAFFCTLVILSYVGCGMVGEWMDCIPEQEFTLPGSNASGSPESLDYNSMDGAVASETSDLAALKAIRRQVADISGYKLWTNETFEDSPCLPPVGASSDERATIFPSSVPGIGCDANGSVVAISLRQAPHHPTQHYSV